jgi:hypothetical protein
MGPSLPTQYTLILRDQAGQKINGTGSQHDLEGTRTFAESILRLVQEAAYIDIHAYSDGA